MSPAPLFSPSGEAALAGRGLRLRVLSPTLIGLMLRLSRTITCWFGIVHNPRKRAGDSGQGANNRPPHGQSRGCYGAPRAAFRCGEGVSSCYLESLEEMHQCRNRLTERP